MLWLSAKEIAEAAAAGLMPGMPTTKRNVNAYADRHRWADTAQARLRGGREGGGGLEYHIDLLPPAALLAWLGHHLKVTDEDLRPEVLDGPADANRDARRVILGLADKFRRQTLMSQSGADSLFCALFNSDRVALPDWIRNEAQSLSPRTLARWRKAEAEGAPSGRRGRPKGSGILDRADGGEVRNLVLALIARHPLLNVRQLRERVERHYGPTLEVADETTGELRRVPLPSLRMFQVAVGEWRKAYRNELLRLTDPDAYRSKAEFVATGTQRADRLNEVWQIDASPADVMLTSGRCSIYMAVDVFSRRAIVLATPTQRAAGVGLLMRKCVETWGVPERIHTDNGSDFTAKWTKRLFEHFGTKIELSKPYEPRSKGIVERAIGTFQRELHGMPGFIGHNVADRKRIESRKAFSARLGASDVELFDVQLDLSQFQAWADDWAENRYAHTPHRGLGGRTPFVVASTYAGEVRRVADRAALDVLLAPVASGDGMRRVTKQGVRIDGAHYLPMGVLPGTDVFVRMDPADLGRAMLFDPTGETFLGEAICPQLAGLDPAEVAARARSLQKAEEAGALASVRSKKRALRDLARIEARGPGKPPAELVAFPQRTKPHATPAMKAAAEAAGAAPDTPKAPSRTPAAAPRNEAFLATFKRPEAPVETRRDRFMRAARLEAQVERGEEVNTADLAWLAVYREQPEYQTQAQMCADFGFERLMGVPRPA